MKRKSSKRIKNSRKNPAHDLFGDVVVTWDDVYLWCERVGGIPRDSWRLEYYIKGWDIPGKVRAAKLSGYYEAAVSERRRYPYLDRFKIMA